MPQSRGGAAAVSREARGGGGRGRCPQGAAAPLPAAAAGSRCHQPQVTTGRAQEGSRSNSKRTEGIQLFACLKYAWAIACQGLTPPPMAEAAGLPPPMSEARPSRRGLASSHVRGSCSPPIHPPNCTHALTQVYLCARTSLLPHHAAQPCMTHPMASCLRFSNRQQPL